MTTIVDDDGRLFGRVNLIDAAIGLALLVAVPLAYGAILLFRPPAPRIASVERVPLSNVEERTAGGISLGGKLKVHGTGLRPNMRAEIAGHRAIAFVFETPASADVIFGSDVEPGTHDLVLFDGQQQVARAAGAVTIAPPPPRPAARVRLVGALIDLDESHARALQQGSAFRAGNAEAVFDALDPAQNETHELVQRGGSIDVPVTGLWQRPAAVVMTCEPSPAGCQLGTAFLEAVAVVRMPGAPDLKLRVDEVLPADPPRRAMVRVRFVGTPESVARVKTGDRDRGSPALTARSASIESIANRKETAGDIVTLAQRPAGSVLAWAIDRVAVIDATLRIAVDPGGDAWRYRSRLVKAGAPFTFDTTSYTLQGTVLSLDVDTGGVRAADR